MSESHKHLDAAQIETLLQGRTFRDQDENSSDLYAFRNHIAECASCRDTVARYEDAGRRFGTLKLENPSPGRLDCPENKALIQLAAGLVDPHRGEAVVKHVTSCDRCSWLLRRAIADFDESPTKEEEALLAQLRTSNTSSQTLLARRLSVETTARGAAARSDVAGYRIGRLIVVFTAAAVIAALAWLGFRVYSHEQPSYVTGLLARSYADQRTLEIRIPGAPYAPMRVERGQNPSRMDRPSELLEAENIIANRLARNPDSPDWLQAKGRADLLDGNYDAAMSSFERAIELNPDDLELQADLASAYFSRAESQEKVSDYAKAVDLYGKVLQKEPKNLLALFNRAIAYERLSLYQQAIEDWGSYLKFDSSSPWSAEARDHLELLQLKERQRGNSSLTPLVQPEQFDSRMRETPSNTALKVRIEEYQAAAVRDWLPGGYPLEAGQRQLPTAISVRSGLRRLATTLSDDHADSWLHDLLISSRAPEFPAAVVELGEAVKFSERADYTAALRHATDAKKNFISMDNTAGMLRAQFERIFALHFSNNALDCVRESEELLNSRYIARYPWIRAQTRIELGICENLLGEFGPASAVLAQAVTDGQTAGYIVTAQRALTMSALVHWSSGDSEVAWQQLGQGANTCWSVGCPAMTLYSIYANMDNFAEDSSEWYLQVALAKEAIAAIGPDNDVLMRAVEHNRLAKAAVLTQQTQIAEQNFAAAKELLATAPKSEVTLHYEAGINLDLAKLAQAQGNLSLAEHYLALVQPQIASIADHYILLDYFGILAGLRLREGQLQKAEDSLRWAIAIAEIELTSLNSDRDRLTWMSAAKDTYSSWVGLELRRNQPELAFRIWEFYLSASLRTGVRPSSPSAISNDDVFVRNQRSQGPPPFPVVDALPSKDLLTRETLISYAIVSGQLVAWVSDDRGLYFFPLNKDAAGILNAVPRFLRDCSSPTASLRLLRDQAEYLYIELIKPISSHLEPTRTLLIDGDPAVVNFPMQALVDESGRYLADIYATSTLPSLYFLVRSGSRRHLSADSPALVVSVSGATRDAENVSHLADAGREANAIARKFVGARLIENENARPEVIQREIPRAVVFHFAGHTRTGSAGTGLLLAESTDRTLSALLDAKEIRSLRLNALDLAVLSACSTEGSGKAGLQDADSLAEAFLDSGVPHVLASRWPVDSATTTRLMSTFYDNLLSGQSFSAAVRSAEMRIRLEPNSAKPYYWAAFSSFGAP